MHPRNRYKDKPPNYAELAKKYPSLAAQAAHRDDGKFRLGIVARTHDFAEMTLDFSQLETTRTLTQVLLQEDFNLDVELPQGHLIPTVTSRLTVLCDR